MKPAEKKAGKTTGETTTSARPTREELEAFLQRSFGQQGRGPSILVEEVTDGLVRLRMPFNEKLLRPGGTIAGPVLMSMADTALYMLVLRNLGLDAAKAVTSNLNMSFLRRPPAVDLLAHGRLLKLGRRLAVGEVSLISDGQGDPVAHAMVTYALP